MATFSERIQAITGFDADSSGNAFDSTTYQTLTNEWLAQGVREVVSSLPPQLLNLMSSANAISSGSGLTVSSVGNAKILSVSRNDGSIDQPCREIPPSSKGRASSSSGYFDEATTTDPVYYIENNTIHILPAPSASSGANSGNANIVAYPTLLYSESESSHSTTPKEFFEPVIIYASIKALEYLAQSEEDIDLYIPILNVIKEDYQRSIGLIVQSYLGADAQVGGE